MTAGRSAGAVNASSGLSGSEPLPIRGPQRKSNAMLAASYLRRKIYAREWNETRRGMKQKLLEDKIVVVTGASRGVCWFAISVRGQLLRRTSVA